MIANDNIILIAAAFILALGAIYALYAIILYQGGKGSKGNELQLSTKNILEQVEILFEKREFALVQLLATKYLDRVPSHIQVRQYLAQAYFEDKKYNNAIKQCHVILKKNPNDHDTRKILGDCYIRKEMLGKAIKEYESFFDNKRKDKEVVRTLAELYRNTDQIFSSISVYNILSEISEANDEIAEIQKILAELNEEVKDYPAAFEAYKTRLGIYPTDTETNQNLIALYIKLKNYPKAIETLLYVLTFSTEPKIMLWCYERLVDLYVETEEYEKAIECSNKMLEIQGSDKFKIRNDIATFELKLDHYEKGISILEELVMMSQNGYDVTIQLAESYTNKKEYEKALNKYLELLDKATQKEAKNLHSLICDLYITWSIDKASEGAFEDAYHFLNEASQYNMLNSEIYYNIALNKIAQKDSAGAIDYLHKALDYDKEKTNHTKYYLKLSEAHHILGHFFEEKKALSDLLKLDPKDAMGLYRSGLMYVSQHDTKNAEDYFKKALATNPELIEAKHSLALIYENNNKDKAKELYIEILEQDPTNKEIKDALANLASSDY